jgi:hypothetical protein
VKCEDVDPRDSLQRLQSAAEVVTVRCGAEENARGDESRQLARLMHRHLQRIEVLRAQPLDLAVCEHWIANNVGNISERLRQIRRGDVDRHV